MLFHHRFLVQFDFPHHVFEEGNHRHHSAQSAVAYRWLACVSHQQGVYIQRGRNDGERRVGPCFPGDTFNPVSGLTMHELYERTQVKTTFLKRQGWQVVEMWECVFHDLLQRDMEANTYVDSLKDIVDPLNPRDAFYGVG